ncbi:MAG TPA: hypothetical protein DDW50_16700, partial [Firmicutes bacterium]|nr:hypothetical protein [Bacillota bacterium]
FHTTLTPVKTGLLSLGPVTLNCNIIVKSKDSDGFFDDFFPSYEKQSVQVKSKKISLNILPIPTANRPANFSGGIGQFQLKVSATPLTVNQGDPITVKMDLSGKGNLQAINAPILQNSSGLKVYDPQRKSSSVQNGDGGDISFEQVLIPVDDKIKRIGPFVFSYFNPATGSYQQIAAPSIPVSVKTNPEFNESSVGDNGNQNEHLGRDLVFIKDSPGQLRLTKNRLYDQPWFWILQLLPLLGLLAAFYYNRHQKMLQSNSPAARSIRAGRVAQKQLEKSNQALADGKLDELLDELHSIIRTYLAEKYNLTVAGMTGDVVDILREHGITEPTLEKIKAFFTKYDFYRFTGATMTKDAATALWNDVNWIIEDLNHSSANVPKTETKPSPSEWKGVGH